MRNILIHQYFSAVRELVDAVVEDELPQLIQAVTEKAGDFKRMAAQITDEHIATFASESTWDGLADALVETNGGIAMRIALYIAPSAITSARAMRRRRATHIEPMTLAPITSCAQTVPVARVW